MVRCSSAALRVLVVVCLVLAGGLDAQLCGVAPTFQFKRVADRAGDPSFITSTGQTVPYTKDLNLPPVIVQLSTGANSFDYSLDGRLVVATLVPALRLGGYSVELNKGEAIFDALNIQELPGGTPSQMIFTVEAADGTTYTLRTGNLEHVPVSAHAAPHTVMFKNSGFFTRAGLGREAPVAPAPVPPFGLQVLNRVGYPITVVQPTVTVTATDATVSPTTYSTTAITGLQITPTGNLPTLTFQVSLNGGAFTGSVSTGALQLVTTTQRNKFMLFDEDRSFIPRENQGNTAVLGTPMPVIVINIYDSAMAKDATNTGLIITASTPQGTLSGAEALVVRGVATFKELVFTGSPPRSAVITFTAGTQAALPVAGSTLLSGSLSVTSTAIKAKHLSFSYTSSANAQTALAIATGPTGGFEIPPVTVNVLDSGYSFDPTAMDFRLRATVDPTDAVTGGPAMITAPVTSGTAVFKGFNFTAATKPFVLRVTDDTDASVAAAALRTPIESRTVRAIARTVTDAATARNALADCELAASTKCVLSLAFTSEFGTFSSHVHSTDQQLFATVGAPLPTIVLELRDDLGVASQFPRAIVPALVAYTADDPNAETLLVTSGGANRGTWQNGRYRFGCLQFRTAPTGLVRIQFMPIDETRTPAIRLGAMLTDGIPIRTGFVTVTENPATNYGLRFTQSLSAIAYPGQRAAAVLNVALPSIAIEFVDSLERFDSTDSSAVIVATTSSGTLDPAGTTQRVSRGRVTFSSLVFRSIADDPTVTFTVFGTNLPVVGKSLAFGPIQMSTLPIPASQLFFSSQNTDNNNVTYAFKGLTFSNGTDPTVVASVVVADSAGQLSTPSEVASVGPITVQVTSDEAVFDGPATVTVDPTSVCACANFSNTITAYKDGVVGGSPIYLRYTVVEAAGLLRGKVVVAGPIFATDLPAATAASSCSASVVAKKVIAEFRMPRTVFEARNVTQELALLLGVLPARIQIERSTLKEVIRVDPKTLKEWTGTKAVFTFTDPLETSSNRKSSSELADEFVTLRPNCDAVSLELAAVYTEAADRSCDKDAFELSLAKTKDCVTAGTDDLCRCYATGVIAEWGQTCSEDVSLRETLTSICRQLATCQDAETQNVCDNLLPPQAVDLVWLWGTLGAVGGVGLMVLAANSQGFFRGKQKTTLGNF